MSSLLTTRYLHKAPFMLEAIGIQMPEVLQHPNRSPFQAVLTQVDTPSTRPPNGSDSHKVFIPRAVADAALPSLIGMAVDCQPENFADHVKRTKIGVITEAHIDGNNLVISGHLFEKDFKDEVSYIRKNKSRMGASYEISDVSVKDPTADIWELDHFVFTGAALLFKSKAAYQETSVLVAAAEEFSMLDTKEILDQLKTLNDKASRRFSKRTLRRAKIRS